MLGAITPYLNIAPRGHAITFYQALREWNKSELCVISSIDASPLNSIPFFSAEFSNQYKVITPHSVTKFKSDNLFKLAVNSNFQEILFYDGDFFCFAWAWNLAIKPMRLRVHYNFHFSDYWVPALGIGSKDTLFAKNLRQLVKNSPDNFFLYAESTNLASEISKKLEIDVTTFPVFSNSYKSIRNLLSKPEFEKDIDVLITSVVESQDWIRNFLKEPNLFVNNNLKIVIQGEELDFSIDETLADFAFLPPDLSEVDYSEITARSRISILPYFSSFYNYGSSGRFEDALAASALPIVPPDTAMYNSLSTRYHQMYKLENFEPSTVVNLVLSYLNLDEKLPEPITPDQSFSFLHTAKNDTSNIKRNMKELNRLKLIKYFILQFEYEPIKKIILGCLEDFKRTIFKF
jgi:hypothetical protein